MLVPSFVEHIFVLDFYHGKSLAYSTTYRYVTYASNNVISNVPLSCTQCSLLQQLKSKVAKSKSYGEKKTAWTMYWLRKSGVING